MEALEPRTLFSASGFTEPDADFGHVSSEPPVMMAALPSPANALTVDDIKSILSRAIKRARQLKVNATIAITDREGNLLAVVRTADAGSRPAALWASLEAGGRGGLEAIEADDRFNPTFDPSAGRIVPTSLIAATKAGTAAFLSTSRGNAFTTRTAGQIIQRHFPPGVRQRPGGPLFGVQLSSLPTSDVNRLPLGLSADPGGLPLYRNGELVGGIGVEVNGRYIVDRSGAGGRATKEEKIAKAGQIGLRPPARMRADRIFVDGIRLEYVNGGMPKRRSLGNLPDYDLLTGPGGSLVELLKPRETPTGPTGRQSIFALTSIATPAGGSIRGEVPDASQAPNGTGLDFYDEATDSLAFLDGDADPGSGERLSANEVLNILGRAHALNHQLRAAIRTDRPQRSHVSVAVVDFNGNVLGVFRTGDAPVFGYDVAVQKARSVAFLSRPDAGAELRQLDVEVDVATLQGVFTGRDEQLVDPGVSDPYGRHVDRMQAIGIDLDGDVALAARSIGFLSRPNLPDGISGAPRGPLTALAPDRFSPFNTGLQTTLIIPELVEFLLAFNSVGNEAEALAMFAGGTLGGGGVVPLESNAGGLNTSGLPVKSLANGLQIFSGAVPLYQNGVLVGAIGVSGDGIEQDDYVAFAGAGGGLPAGHPQKFQSFGPGVARADQVVLRDRVRLPYVKLPRAPFEGL